MKTYEGTCYIGVAGSTLAPMQAIISILNITRREGDSPPNFIWGTKGYETRQSHINKFMESEHDFCLLLDHDMIFSPTTLEILRMHRRPFVSGYYLRRRYSPLVSVWYEPFDGRWPMYPYTDIPPNELVEIGASGWGCMLIHREVIEKTRELLNGEWDIAELMMREWPHTGEPLFPNWDKPVGSDVRYPIYAKHAGYPLYGDANVAPAHILDYPITLNDFASQSPEIHETWTKKIRDDVDEIRGQQ